MSASQAMVVDTGQVRVQALELAAKACRLPRRNIHTLRPLVLSGVAGVQLAQVAQAQAWAPLPATTSRLAQPREPELKALVPGLALDRHLGQGLEQVLALEQEPWAMLLASWESQGGLARRPCRTSSG